MCRHDSGLASDSDCLIVSAPLAQTSQAASDMHSIKTISRLNFGVFLQPVDNVDIVTDVWSQSYVIRLPSVDTSGLRMDDFDCAQFGHADSCHRIINLLRYLRNMTTKAVREIHETIRHIRHLFPEYGTVAGNNTNGRIQRGLLDFVGEISHSLFGTARSSDIENVQQTIQQLKQQQFKLASSWEKASGRLASYGSALNHRVDALNAMIESQRTAVQTIFNDLTRETSDLTQATTTLARALSRFQDFVTAWEHLDVFRNGLQQLSHGMLSADLILPADIYRALQAVKTRVNSLGLRVLRPKVMHYFKMHDFLVIRHGDNIIVHLPIPLGVLQTALRLYKVHVVPMVIPGSPRHATVLTDAPKFIAYHPNSPYYLEFDVQPQISKSGLLFLEEAHTILKSVSTQNCFLHILHDRVTKVKRFCRFAVIPDYIQPALHVLDRGHVLLTNITALIQCPNKLDHSVTCSASCRVTIPCGCSLTAADMYIPQHLQGCVHFGEP